jgi:hypothetical protein
MGFWTRTKTGEPEPEPVEPVRAQRDRSTRRQEADLSRLMEAFIREIPEDLRIKLADGEVAGFKTEDGNHSLSALVDAVRGMVEPPSGKVEDEGRDLRVRAKDRRRTRSGDRRRGPRGRTP